MTVQRKIRGLMLLCLAATQEQEWSNSSCSSPEFAGRANTCAHFVNKGAKDCLETFIKHWPDDQIATLLDSLQQMAEVLQKQQKQACKNAVPPECPAPEVPDKGGLVCVSVEEKRYCKPMCNEGYDFSFMRRGKPHEECSSTTRYKWTTQYVGGNKLAVCDKSSIQISGVASAYFPKDQNCLQVKSNTTMKSALVQTFVSELRNRGIDGSLTHACLICG